MLEKAIRVAQSLEAADKNAKKLKAEEAASTLIHRTGHYHNARPPGSCCGLQLRSGLKGANFTSPS